MYCDHHIDIFFLYKVIYIVEVIYLYFQFYSKSSLHRFFTLLHFFLLLKFLNVVSKSRTLSKCSSFIRFQINNSTCPRINLVDPVSNQTILYFWKTNVYLPNSMVNKLEHCHTLVFRYPSLVWLLAGITKHFFVDVFIFVFI